MKRLQWP